MSAFDALRYRVHVLRRVLFDRERWRHEMDAELTHHRELATLHGAPGSGNPARVRERLVDDSGASALDALRQDLRFAWRALRARPAFTLVAVLTLGVGIGGNAAIFSAVHAMLLRQLPFAEPARLVKVSMTRPARGPSPANDDAPWSYPKFVVFRDAQDVFSDLTLYTGSPFTLRTGDAAERLQGEYVDARYLPTLGIHPALGRNFVAEEDAIGAPRVVLLSDALWRRRYDADSAILGRAIHLAGEPYVVVGVLPPRFRGLTGQAELLVPMLTQPDMVEGAWSHGFTLVGRLAAGVSHARAAEATRLLGQRVDAAYPHPQVQDEHWGAVARPLDASRVDPVVKRALLVLLGAVGLVLLVVCANVANLLLVRAAGRRRELALRVALGAGRGRLVRQLLTESVLLAALGGVVGVAIAWWGTRALAAVDPTRLLRTNYVDFGAVRFDSIRLDGTALALIAGLVVLTGVLFGIAPALQATRPSLTGGLKDGGHGASRGPSTRSALATLEVALALVLLAGSGLMLRSLANLLAVSPGVDPAGVLTLRLGSPPGLAHDSLPGFYQDLVSRVQGLPGVTGVALQDCPPLNGGCNGTVVWRRDIAPVRPGDEPPVGVHWITPTWPAVMRVPVVRGRAFSDADRAGAPKVVLVSETAARTIWPGEDPIGKPVSVGQGGFDVDTARVVGVVGDVRYETPDAPMRADVYLPFYQSPSRVMLFVRTPGDPLALAGAVRRVANELAPGAPVFEIGTLDGRVRDALAFARFGTLLLSLFAALALVLAALGVYGVVSFATAQRTREIGVRVALGATRRDVLRLVVGHGVAIAAVGALAGLLAALAATRTLRALLYGVGPSDPTTFAAIVAVLAVTVLVASWLPARRAVGVAPTEALRTE